MPKNCMSKGGGKGGSDKYKGPPGVPARPVPDSGSNRSGNSRGRNTPRGRK
jgi:hypothetical protein